VRHRHRAFLGALSNLKAVYFNMVTHCGVDFETTGSPNNQSVFPLNYHGSSES